jgi:lysophospholipase L1-like esterase
MSPSHAVLALSALLALAACSLWPFGRGPSPRVVAVRVEQAPPPAAQQQQQQPAPTGGCSVVLYGDSILHGGYDGTKRLDEPPAAVLKRTRPRFTVEDVTVNGETANFRAAGFAAERRGARFVVIAHGINDAAQSLPLEAPLRAMVNTARGEGRVVILTGLSHQRLAIPGRDRYDAVIRKVARDTGVAFADWGSVEYRAADMADLIHPARPYSERLVKRIADVLDALAPECRV